MGDRLSAEEITFIQNNSNKMTLPDICIILNKSKSTVYYHFSKYRQKEVTLGLRKESSVKAANTVKVKKKKQAINSAKLLFNKHKLNTSFLLGIYLYWAEGTKSKFGFANTDVKMIRTMIKWFNDFVLPHAGCEMRYYIQSDPELKEESLGYWSESLCIDKKLINCYNKSNNTRVKYGVFYIRPVYVNVGNIQVFVKELIDECFDFVNGQ